MRRGASRNDNGAGFQPSSSSIAGDSARQTDCPCGSTSKPSGRSGPHGRLSRSGGQHQPRARRPAPWCREDRADAAQPVTHPSPLHHQPIRPSAHPSSPLRSAQEQRLTPPPRSVPAHPLSMHPAGILSPCLTSHRHRWLPGCQGLLWDCDPIDGAVFVTLDGYPLLCWSGHSRGSCPTWRSYSGSGPSRSTGRPAVTSVRTPHKDLIATILVPSVAESPTSGRFARLLSALSRPFF